MICFQCRGSLMQRIPLQNPDASKVTSLGRTGGVLIPSRPVRLSSRSCAGLGYKKEHLERSLLFREIFRDASPLVFSLKFWEAELK